ncbi:uncharacterized protein LOC131665772 isoform X1 [Phymastichus coffea]|uniref:uncharacterized protein LOC131665772 isoform X1 n=1 Tax=Phymastichus coffea TaxID=108790 RepID=UPI00273C5849|nr:uncharacterized protein LOC131665772 isoform X1 [Phymastichus coffea]
MVFVTEIEDRTSPKPFLGGWRDVARDLEYHDATCQTPTEFSRPRQRISRPVQTFAIREYCSRFVQLDDRLDKGVQANWLIPQLGECVLKANDLNEQTRRDAAAVTVQRFYRAYRRRKFKGFNQDDKREKSQSPGKTVSFASEDGDNDEHERPAFDATIFRDYQSPQILGELHIIQPSDSGAQDRLDLNMLHGLLDRWSVAEEAKIRNSLDNELQRIDARTRMLEQEIDVLRAIDSSRCEITRRKAERARAKFLEELAKPIELEVPCSSRTKHIHVDTLNVQRAREFRELYDTLLLEEDEDLGEFERMELLFALKKCISLHTCQSSLSLERLIDQELYLLASHVQPATLKYLRSRIRLGFLRLARGALGCDYRIKHLSRTRLCLSCGKLRRLEAFAADHRERISRTCVYCETLGPKRRNSQVYSEIYERMLRELRRSEAARADGTSSLAFVMGPKAIGYLVNDIWHGRSAISECSDLDRLRLVRLDPNSTWTPWNTLLVTRSEAMMHESLMRESCAVDVYDAELVRKFRRMNLQARLYFENIVKYTPTCYFKYADTDTCLF